MNPSDDCLPTNDNALFCVAKKEMIDKLKQLIDMCDEAEATLMQTKENEKIRKASKSLATIGADIAQELQLNQHITTIDQIAFSLYAKHVQNMFDVLSDEETKRFIKQGMDERYFSPTKNEAERIISDKELRKTIKDEKFKQGGVRVD